MRYLSRKICFLFLKPHGRANFDSNISLYTQLKKLKENSDLADLVIF